jgi:hypothetical protein
MDLNTDSFFLCGWPHERRLHADGGVTSHRGVCSMRRTRGRDRSSELADDLRPWVNQLAAADRDSRSIAAESRPVSVTVER